jgi:hypothetical protein
MERHELGPWAPGGMVDNMRVSGQRGSTSRTCRGEIEQIEAVGRGQRLRGWILGPDGEATSRNLVVLDGGGTPRGLGLVGTYRPDVSESGVTSSDWTGFAAYVRDEPKTPLAVVLFADDRRTPVCRLVATGS